MTYKEFDKKFNKRDHSGVITHCSLIDIYGEIIFQGELNDVENFHDDNFEWERDGWAGVKYINGREVNHATSGFTNVNEMYFNEYYKYLWD